MQAIAPKQERPAQAPAQESESATISLRAVTALEIASVIASVLVTTWALIPLQPRQRWLTAIPALLAIGLMINSHRVRGESLAELGFTIRCFGRALRLLITPTLLACGAFAAVGYWANSLHRTTHFWSNFLVVPVWALLQQYVLQGFIYRRLRQVLAGGGSEQPANRAILAAAAIFALAHAPNLTLMVLTFLGAWMWSWVYERAPNLFALGLSHAAISLMLMSSLPPWLLESMSVGYKHFLYQKF